MRIVGGGCRLPVGAHAWIENNELKMRGLVASPDGMRIIETSAAGGAPEEIGQRVADALLKQGAQEILDQINAGA